MEIRRFGPGHRRPDGPPGTQGVTGQVIHSDDRGTISELAFGRRALITPHANPNLALFIVISGGGFVQVGEERARVNHGEAVVWPAGELHGAYTDGSEMRAIVVELPDPGKPLVLEGVVARAIGTGTADGPRSAEPRPTTAPVKADGGLAQPERRREDHDETEGEPW